MVPGKLWFIVVLFSQEMEGKIIALQKFTG
jgi:hypothetical protein